MDFLFQKSITAGPPSLARRPCHAGPEASEGCSHKQSFYFGEGQTCPFRQPNRQQPRKTRLSAAADCHTSARRQASAHISRRPACPLIPATNIRLHPDGRRRSSPSAFLRVRSMAAMKTFETSRHYALGAAPLRQRGFVFRSRRLFPALPGCGACCAAGRLRQFRCPGPASA